jgi:hypothetical protein
MGTDIPIEIVQGTYVTLWKPTAEKDQARVNPLKIPPALPISSVCAKR